jgi:demethylmenaquinone methyltransferase/2-methoxy-6-polyprenyl-1,4-benzoquinol methylase
MQISRVKRPKSAAKRAYDRLSHVYDWLAGSSESQFMHEGLELLKIEKGETILEIGCGTGKALLELYRLVGDEGKVFAIDLSRGMLQKSRATLMTAGIQPGAYLLEGDGANLPYQSGSFNAVFISFTLELFDTPEIPQVLDECWRVLLPGGRLGVVSMMKPEHPGVIVRLYEWMHETLPAYVDCRPIDGQSVIHEAGFAITKRHVRNMWGLPIEMVVAGKK